MACVALALGWHMAELYDDALAGEERAREPTSRDELAGAPVAGPEPEGDSEHKRRTLPGVNKLEDAEKLKLRVAQIERGLRLLEDAADEPALRELAEGVQERSESPSGLRSLHSSLLVQLTTLDYRLGKAYGLGRALCDTCREQQSSDDLKSHMTAKHLGKLIAWCEDLKTVLPPHAGQSVADSLRRWQTWDAQGKTDDASLEACLHRQGEIWRSVLSGEKDPIDMLSPARYVEAGEALLADTAVVAWRFVKKFWPPLLLALLLLVGGSIALITGSSSNNNVVAGVVGVAASLGITWKTASSALTNLADELSKPLWGAEQDLAITEALTDDMVPRGTRGSPFRLKQQAQRTA